MWQLFIINLYLVNIRYFTVVSRRINHKATRHPSKEFFSDFYLLNCIVHHITTVIIPLNKILLNMTVKDENDPVNQMLDKLRPHVAKLTFGSLVGYCSGAAAKKIGRALAVICGLGFIAIQSGEL